MCQCGCDDEADGIVVVALACAYICAGECI